MRRRGRRGVEVFSLSFLDAVCCGFGAIILLFVLNKMGEPIALEQAQQELQGLIARLEEELFVIRGETTRFDRVLRSREEQLSKETENVARLRGDLTNIQGRYKASRQLSEIQDILKGRLVAAVLQCEHESNAMASGILVVDSSQMLSGSSRPYLAQGSDRLPADSLVLVL